MAVDATYTAEAAYREWQRRQKRGELDTESGYDKTDTQEALRRLAEQRVPALQNTKQTANKEGLFYSGQLGKRLGDVEKDFSQRAGDTQRDYDRREAARETARRAIESGAPLEEAAAAAAAADRQIARDAEMADANALAPPPAGAPAAAAARPTATRGAGFGSAVRANPRLAAGARRTTAASALARARANRRPRVR